MKRILVASLLSSFALAAAAATPRPANNASTSVPVQVTTGVTAPQLENAAVVQINGDNYLDSIPTPATMLLHVDLNAAGTATKIQVVRPVSPVVDAEVVRAVRQFRWKPAMLDYQAVSSGVDLIVQVQH